MPVDLARLVAPGRAAVVTSEVQEGVVGAASALPALAEAAAGAVTATGRLAAAARAVGVQVVHCTFGRRPDGRGTNTGPRLFRAMERLPVQMLEGTSATDIVAEVGVAPEDLVLARRHGLGPMGGTDLDAVLRNLGVGTLIVAGVSVNVAITNLVMDAVNRGYEVVLPRDAVAGVPAAYADSLIDNTLALLATVTTVDEVIATW
jgi:nicotinamidase-related amidase